MADDIRAMERGSPIRGGKFLGSLGETHPYANPLMAPMEALHPKNLNGLTPEEFMSRRPADEEGFFLPGSELLWIQKHPENFDAPMSALDPETKNV